MPFTHFATPPQLPSGYELPVVPALPVLAEQVLPSSSGAVHTELLHSPPPAQLTPLAMSQGCPGCAIFTSVTVQVPAVPEVVEHVRPEAHEPVHA